MWTEFVDEFLHEMTRLDGRAGYGKVLCPLCHSGQVELRCRDCFGGEMYCLPCVLKAHRHLPLHRTEVKFYAFFLDYHLNLSF
jgi:hypothetical protein